MKEIVVISGKGGTGKTSISAAFSALGGANTVVADCDVDAADMHILLQPENIESHDFISGETAYINQDQCKKCGICQAVCHFDAIKFVNNAYVIDEVACEGCGYCSRICPTKTIENSPAKVGQWHIAENRFKQAMVHAKLDIGADNSGKLVAQVKKAAKTLAQEKQSEYIIIDGSPGIGCPVVSSLSGASFVVLVTEPSASGLHDLKRVHQLVKRFHLPSACIINKYDINADKTKEIETFLSEENIKLLAKLPYNENFTKAMTECKIIVEYHDKVLSQQLQDAWKDLKTYI
jgi:MinD superfamily P-loop ATPase